MGSLDPTTHDVRHLDECGGKGSPGDITNSETERNITELADQLRVQCLRETAVIPQCSMQGSASYDINAAYSYVIPAKGKGIVQTGFAVSLSPGVYAKIAPHSSLAITNLLTWAWESSTVLTRMRLG